MKLFQRRAPAAVGTVQLLRTLPYGEVIKIGGGQTVPVVQWRCGDIAMGTEFRLRMALRRVNPFDKGGLELSVAGSPLLPLVGVTDKPIEVVVRYVMAGHGLLYWLDGGPLFEYDYSIQDADKVEYIGLDLTSAKAYAGDGIQLMGVLLEMTV